MILVGQGFETNQAGPWHVDSRFFLEREWFSKIGWPKSVLTPFFQHEATPFPLACNGNTESFDERCNREGPDEGRA
jgi:hypothetical protein